MHIRNFLLNEQINDKLRWGTAITITQFQVRTSDVAGDLERAVLAKEAEHRGASGPALQPHYYGRVIGIDLLERILNEDSSQIRVNKKSLLV